MYNVGKDRILFFDNDFVDRAKSTAKFEYGKLTKREVVMEFSDDYDREVTYFCLTKCDGFYRMYYVANNRLDKKGNLVNLGVKPHVAAIESKDGINWYKPNYGVVEFNGSKDNNLIDIEIFDNAFIYKDVNPNCPKEEKFKAIHMYYDGDGYTALRCSFSADGITFNAGYTLCEEGTFDTLNTLHYDVEKGQYAIYCRYFHNKDGSDFLGFKDVLNAGNKAIRDFRVIYSKDFKTWTKPVRVKFGDAPDYQLYTNNVERYYRSPRYYIGFPERYMEKIKWDKNYDYLCGKERRVERMKLHPRLGLSTTDHMFICSNDGVNFTMSDKAFHFPGYENVVSWVYGGDKLCYGMVETENPLDFSPEISMYAPCVPWENIKSKLFRFSLRVDGFCFYTAGLKVKKVVSKPFKFNGDKLFFNMATSAAGYVQVVIKDECGNKITSGKVFGDSIDKDIWFDKGDLSAFSGKTVTMEIRLSESEVYSFRFV